jgi:hypothetical protein
MSALPANRRTDTGIGLAPQTALTSSCGTISPKVTRICSACGRLPKNHVTCAHRKANQASLESQQDRAAPNVDQVWPKSPSQSFR